MWFRSALGKDAPQGVKYSAQRVDLNDSAHKLSKIYNAFDQEGYDAVEIVPINEGEYDLLSNVGFVEKFAASYSTTRGAVVVGKRRD